jgi:hypothetical protein
MTIDVMDVAMVFGGFAGAVVLYVLIRVLSLHLTQPIRLELAEKGERLLLEGELSEPDRQVVQNWLDGAFYGAPVIVFSAFFPAIFLGVLALIFTSRLFGKGSATTSLQGNQEVDSRVVELAQIGMYSMAGTSPFAALWLLVQLYAIKILTWPVRPLRRSLKNRGLLIFHAFRWV